MFQKSAQFYLEIAVENTINMLLEWICNRNRNTRFLYSQVPNKRPPPPRLPLFPFLSNSPDLIRIPPFITFKEIYFFTNSSFYFLSLLALFKAHFHSKITCFCIYFNFVLHENLFLSLTTHLKPFLKFQPPPSPLIKFQKFSDPLFIWTLSVYLALESK